MWEITPDSAFKYLKLLKYCANAWYNLWFFFPLQQLVSVRLSEGRPGDMMVLGNVHHKLVLSPDFQTLLRQASAQQQKGPWPSQTSETRDVKFGLLVWWHSFSSSGTVLCTSALRSLRQLLHEPDVTISNLKSFKWSDCFYKSCDGKTNHQNWNESLSEMIHGKMNTGFQLSRSVSCALITDND